ncbi:hypothetical protein C7T35_39885 [Variovorax sp. WS11]|nr:hypothetical protein C7T35_39885 [Variovorax sp. WS11]
MAACVPQTALLTRARGRYPDKPITVLVDFFVDGSTHFFRHLLVKKKLTDALRQPVATSLH